MKRDKTGRLFVMSKARVNSKNIIFDGKDKSVLFIDSNTPPSRKVANKRFWLSDAIKSVALDAFYKHINSFKRLLVFCLPIGIFFPCSVGPKFFHECSLRIRFGVFRIHDFLGFVCAVSSVSMSS